MSRSTGRLFQTLEPRVMYDAAIDPASVDDVEPPACDLRRMEDGTDGSTEHEPEICPPEVEQPDSDSSETNRQSHIADSRRTELVIVDPGVDDYESILDDLQNRDDTDRTLEVFVLDADADGLEQLTAILDGRSDIDALHVISHGDDASFKLGDLWVRADTLTAYAGDIASWDDALSSDADILIYGCDVAESQAGRDLIDGLAALSGADVAASDDDTGSADKGGDWNLEYAAGDIETELAPGETLRASYAHVLAAGPQVSTSGDTGAMLGQSFGFTVTFDNDNGADTGYGPYLDLIIPAGASGNDITINGASYLGTALDVTTRTFPDDGGGTGTIDHPFFRDNFGDPLQITGNAGDTLVVVELPFGSVTPGQPPIDVAFTATLANDAVVGDPLTIQTRSGFRYGNTAANEPTGDPAILSDNGTDVTDPSSGATSWSEQLDVTPTLIEINKTYIGPENETATGPNHTRRYRLSVDIANGETVDNLRIFDDLPAGMVVTQIIGVTAAGANSNAHTDNLASLTQPDAGNTLEIAMSSPITGTAGGSDVVVEFEFYVDETFTDNNDRVIPADGQDDNAAGPELRNNARAVGDWTPAGNTDPLYDPTGAAVADPAGFEHNLDAKSIAVQKSVTVIDGGGNPLSRRAVPGDVLEYTITFQISDYHTFGDLVIDDVFSDGQRFDRSFGGTFTVNDIGGSQSGENFVVEVVNSSSNVSAAGATLTVDEGQIAGTGTAGDGTDGSTSLQFRLSDAMIAAGAADGILQGGHTDGTSTTAATGTITFRTVVQENYSDDYPSGDASVDQGDVLTNPTITIRGTVRQDAEDGDITTTTGIIEEDGSAASIQIQSGTLTKEVFKIGGVDPTIVDGNFVVQPGDVVTYRITYTLPTSDYEDLVLTDFFPLPVFVADDFDADGTGGDTWTLDFDETTFDGVAGTVELGAGDTLFVANNISPTLSTNGSNGLEIAYGNYDNGLGGGHTIELLVNITAQDQPTADGLFLTNIIRAEESSTQGNAVTADATVRVEVYQPQLDIVKGVVFTDGDGTLGTTSGGGVTFSQNDFTGTINSDWLAANAANVDRDLTDADAGDVVTFALVVENTGRNSNGAFDVSVVDTLDANLSLVGGSIRVVDGDGNNVSHGGNLFTTGITLNDGGTGAIGSYHDGSRNVVTDGSNILVILYDAVVEDTATANATYTESATLTNYAARNNGNDYTGNDDPTDAAAVNIDTPSIDKTLTSTSIDNGGNNGPTEVVVGEEITYTLTIDLTEGTTENLVIIDVLDAGLVYRSHTVAVGSNLTAATPNPTPGVGNAGSDTSARRIAFNFGDVVNNSTDDVVDAGDDQIVITITAVVDNVRLLDSSGNPDSDNSDNLGNNTGTGNPGDIVAGLTDRNNRGTVRYDGGGDISDWSPNVTVIEPVLTVDTNADVATADVANPIEFTITIDNVAGTYGADAHDVVLRHLLDSGLTFVDDAYGAGVDFNVTSSSGVTTGSAAGLNYDAGTKTIEGDWDTFAEGGSITFKFQATANSNLTTDGVDDTSQITWTSLPGTGSAAPNAVSYERTGDTSDPGTTVNTYAASDGVTVAFPITPTKTITATSEAHTDDTTADTTGDRRPVAIGEVVSFELRTVIGEGSLDDVLFRDTLTAGMSILTGTVTFEIVADAAMTVDDGSTSGLSDLTGANSGEISLNSDRITIGAASGGFRDIDFNLGDIVNNDNDAGGEQIIIRYDAVMNNTASNDNGDSRTNAFALREGGEQRATSNTVYMTVVEPRITDVAKVVTSTASDGSTADYRITFSNTGGAAAFELNLTDTMPAGLSLQTGTINVATTGTVTGIDTSSSSATALNIDVASMAAGASITITYTADVTYASAPISNNATVIYTSLPSDNGTGDATPGGPGDADGERDHTSGSGVEPNDFIDSDTARLGSIGDRVFHDIDGDGVFDAADGDHGLGGVDVRLLWYGNDGNRSTTTDNQTRTVTTDSDGFYVFTAVPAGTYDVTVDTADLPSGITTATTDRDGTSSDHTTTLTLDDATVGGMTVTDADFGYRGSGSIGDRVWFDYDGDGVRDDPAGTANDEPWIGGVDLTLVWGGIDGTIGDDPLTVGVNEGDDDVAYTDTTDGDGRYGFANLPAGTFRVTVDTSTIDVGGGGTYVLTTDNQATDGTDDITLTTGQDYNDADYGYRGTSSIGDLVFLDFDGDGVRDIDDGGTPGDTSDDTFIDIGYVGLTVTLQMDFDDDGSVDFTATTTTDQDGAYAFANLPPGAYTVTVTQAPATDFTVDPDNAAAPATDDNDGISELTLTDGQTDDTRDFALTGTGSIGDLVWQDLNGDGVQDAGEPGIDGVTVRLDIDLNADGTVDATRTTATDADGGYSFADVPAGTHTITVVNPPAGLSSTHDRDDPSGGMTPAGTNHSAVVTIDASNTAVTDADFGYRGNQTITGDVYWDVTNLGTFDASETGLVGTTVYLDLDYDGDVSNGYEATVSTTIGTDGTYTFENLGSQLYRVRVDAASGLVATEDPDDTGLPGSPPRDNQTLLDLTDGLDQTGIDFGYRGAGSIGDRIYWDRDNDGSFTTGDEGLGGVDVTLSIDTDNDTVADYTRTVQTAADGTYTFDNLIAGTYTITVDDTDLPADFASNPTDDPDGRFTSGPNTGNIITPHTADVTLASNTAVNTTTDFGYRGTGSVDGYVHWDTDGSGTYTAYNPTSDTGDVLMGGLTVTLTVDYSGSGAGVDETFTTLTAPDGSYSFSNLPAGSYTVTVTPPADTTWTDDPDNGTAPTTDDNDGTAAFTLATGGTRTGDTFGFTGDGSIGDIVFFDYDGDGSTFGETGDFGWSGITVTLETTIGGNDYTFTTTTAADNPVTTGVDETGTYLFDHLIAGTYTITVDDAGLRDDVGDNPTHDRDGVLTPNTATVSIVSDNPVTTGVDETDLVHDDVDFGYHATPDYTVTIDDGVTTARAGDTVTTDLTLTNTGGHRGEGVTLTYTYDPTVVTITDPDGGTDDGAGTITWTIGTLGIETTGDEATNPQFNARSFTVTSTVNEIQPDNQNPLDASVTVTDNAAGGLDPTRDLSDGVNNRATDTAAIADLTVTKRVTAVTLNGDDWDVAFEIVVANTGSVRLDDLTLVDNLAARFGSALVGVSNLTIDASGATSSDIPAANEDIATGWAGGTRDLLDPSDTDDYLAAGDSFVVTFTATVDPDATGTAVALDNQATATGTDVTTTPATPVTVIDLSDSGTSLTTTNPDAPGDPVRTTGDPDDSTTDDPTPVFITDIAVTKQQSAATFDPTTRNYTVDYVLHVENIGTADLNDVKLTDDVATRFGDLFVNVVAGSLSVASTTGTVTDIVVNTAWETDTSEAMLAVTVPDGLGIRSTARALSVGASFEIRFSVVVDPDGSVDGLSRSATNQATATGRGLDETGAALKDASNNDIVASDLSDSGINANTTNADQPGDTTGSDDPTPLVLPEIAAAKRLVSSSASPSGNRALTYEIVIRNVGTVDLTDIDLIEDLDDHFGVAFLGIISPPTITASTATTDPVIASGAGAYDGDTRPNVFDSDSGLLQPGETVTVRFTVDVDVDQLTGTSTNQVLVRGEWDARPLTPGRDGIVTDLSDSGTDPSTANTPGTTHDDPTPIPGVGITLDHLDPFRDPDTGNWTVPVSIVVENLGATALTNLDLREDLIARFGDAFVSVDNVVLTPTNITDPDSVTPVVNPNWTTDVTANLLDGTTGRFAPGESFTITFDMVVDPDATGTSGFADNVATIAGSDPDNPATTVLDRSDSGIDPDDTNAGQPGDTGTADDPTPLNIPDLSITHEITSAVQRGLTYDVTMRYVLENIGTTELHDIDLVDDLAEAWGGNFSRIVSAPRIISTDATVAPTVNAAMPGTDTTVSLLTGDPNQIDPGQTVVIEMVVEVAAMPGQTGVTLVNQAQSTTTPTQRGGSTLLRQDNTPLGDITDLSDNGFDPNTTNPGFPGDRFTRDDPTPIPLTFFTFDAYNDFSNNRNGQLVGDRGDSSNPFDPAKPLFTDTPLDDAFETRASVRPDPVYGGYPTGRSLSLVTPAVLAPEPIYSGTARPGSQIIGRVYDSTGAIIGEELSIADVGGNWMMQFQGLDSPDQVRVEFTELTGVDSTFDSTGDIYGYLGLDRDDNEYASLEPWTFFDDGHDFTATFRPTVKQTLDRAHRLHTRPLGLGL